MALTAGTRLGPYEILAPLGAGGMGQVYKVRDTRLDRTVAVKVSNEQFSERFEREAHAIAALNHAHICQLYDVGPNYLVMELIDGQPLKGPLPLEQTLTYAAQICDALCRGGAVCTECPQPVPGGGQGPRTQSVFCAPPRRPNISPYPRLRPPRRHAKNALRYQNPR